MSVTVTERDDDHKSRELRALGRRCWDVHQQGLLVGVFHYLARCNRYSDTPLGVTEYLGLTKGTVSQSLKVLEGRGLISKLPDARDRRSVHLRLTDAGRALIEAVIPPQFLEQAVTALGEKGEHLQGLLRDPGKSNRKTILWFAKDWDYLLVRLYQMETDGKEYQIMLKEGTIDGKTVTGEKS